MPSEADADAFGAREGWRGGEGEEEAEGAAGREPGSGSRSLSSLAEASRLLALLVRHGLKTLAFVKARAVAELLVERTRALLPPEQAAPCLATPHHTSLHLNSTLPHLTAPEHAWAGRATPCSCTPSHLTTPSPLRPPGQAERLQCYRAGYTKEARRAIEAELFEGRLLGVVATNALELGVDVGTLDAVRLPE